MSKSLVQKALADMLSALGQKALADRLSAWAPEPEEPQGSQHLVEVVTCPWEPAGKPVAEVVELATVAPAWVCCGNHCIHQCLASHRHSCQQVRRRQGHLR